MLTTYPPLKTGSLLAGHHTPAGEQKALVLLDKNGQKVIYKTFAAGERMPTHHAPAEVLVTVLAGRLVITVLETSTEVEAGDYLVIPAGAPHALDCLEAARILIFR
ncbi:cupin domain-containing protein [Hymenobacter properus]|uniref:Cupin domain-containing protein n=1 Tax=Hymenobacter properus TaxID=2791026 RepID=A0A931BHW0_9BACT|nr:cupin domain-containing protein [Hymenobacter properus]MBF9141622.1 cupin domain-containing protein [Hymenobacter properus]MBR7720431.1 cupin domain-containing protein [Microvirga sp. SRT04]